MDLPQALKRVLAFPSRKVDDAGYIGFCQEPQAVCAVRGIVGICVFVDEPIAAACLPVPALREVARGGGISALREHGNMEVEAVRGKESFVMRGQPIGAQQLPPLPADDAWAPCPDFWLFQKIIKLPSAEHPFFEVGSDFVAATDGIAVGVTYLALGVAGWLPAQMFAGWAKRNAMTSVDVALLENVFFVRVGSELRWGRLLAGGPQLLKLVPIGRAYHEFVVDVAALSKLVQTGCGVSDAKFLELLFYGSDLRVRAVVRSAPRGEYSAAIAGESTLPNRARSVVVSATRLKAALKNVHTDFVRLSFRSAADPLRVDCGGYTEAIWPVLGVEGSHHDCA